jgi:hypothetical protein
LRDRASGPGVALEPFADAKCVGTQRMPNTPSHCRVVTPQPNPGPLAASGALPSGDALISALTDAASSLSESAPRLAECRILAYRDSLPPGLVGAYVPVLGAGSAIHVGILSDVCSCDALAWLLEASVSRSDLGTRTALCELTQRLARALARRASPDAPLAVGEPVFVDGVARRTRSARVRAVEVVFGVTRATLVVVGSEALIQSDWPGMDNRARSRLERDRA